jgi:hypothetical protein
MEWKDGKMIKAGILSRLGGLLTVRYDGETRTYNTKKGERIQFTPTR